MSGILDMLDSDLGRNIVSGVSTESGQPFDKTSNLLTLAMPVLMQAMKRNVSSPEGAQSLMGALSDKHDGSLLDNLDGFFGGGVDKNAVYDGGKILGHVLGGKQANVETALGSKTGMDASSVSQILKIAAPILLGYLGKKKRQQAVHDSSSLEGFLGGMLRANSPQHEQSFLSSFLDADGDGSIIDDVAEIMLNDGGNKKKGGIGGLLGNLFKRT